MTRDEIRTLIDAAYAARRDEDVPRALAAFAPDGRFRIAAHPGLGPLGAPATGTAELGACFAAMFALWNVRDFALRDVVIDADARPQRAAVRWTARLVHAPSGQAFAADVLDLLAFTGSRIAELAEYLDTDLFAPALRAPG